MDFHGAHGGAQVGDEEAIGVCGGGEIARQHVAIGEQTGVQLERVGRQRRGLAPRQRQAAVGYGLRRARGGRKPGAKCGACGAALLVGELCQVGYGGAEGGVGEL